MQLAATRHISFEGSTVVLAPASHAEAKAALKELRHKKRELTWHRKSLLRRKKTATERASKKKRTTSRRKSSWSSRLADAWAFLMGLPSAFAQARGTMDVADIERQVAYIDELTHNIDSAIIQVEGRLLNAG